MIDPGFFTELPSHALPHPRVPLRIVLATHTAIARAFEILKQTPPPEFQIETAMEDEITRRLHAILEDRFLSTDEVAGFDRRRFRNVVRAPEISNFDGTHPAKKPDLVLFLLKRESWHVRSSQDGIFAECKPVDDSHPVGKHYCDSGIARFVNGDYAWAMQDGFMVAYVRGKRTVPKHLTPVLAGRARHGRLGAPNTPTLVTPAVQNLHHTQHARSFEWSPDRRACGINLYHSWHTCD